MREIKVAIKKGEQVTLGKMVNFQKNLLTFQILDMFLHDGFCKQNEEEWGAGDGAFSACSRSNFLSLDPSPKLASTYSQKKKKLCLPLPGFKGENTASSPDLPSLLLLQSDTCP